MRKFILFFLLCLVQRYVPFCIVPVRRNRLLSNVFVFLDCKSVSNILPGYCSGTLEIMKKKIVSDSDFFE